MPCRLILSWAQGYAPTFLHTYIHSIFRMRHSVLWRAHYIFAFVFTVFLLLYYIFSRFVCPVSNKWKSEQMNALNMIRIPDQIENVCVRNRFSKHQGIDALWSNSNFVFRSIILIWKKKNILNVYFTHFDLKLNISF